MKTTRTDCEHCGTRLLIIRSIPRIPRLNWGQDPAGQVAVTIDDPRRGRFLAKGEQPGPLEHRHGVHRCEGPATSPAQPQLLPGMARGPDPGRPPQ
jgi:hypothetical protein